MPADGHPFRDLRDVLARVLHRPEYGWGWLFTGWRR